MIIDIFKEGRSDYFNEKIQTYQGTVFVKDGVIDRVTKDGFYDAQIVRIKKDKQLPVESIRLKSFLRGLKTGRYCIV